MFRGVKTKKTAIQFLINTPTQVVAKPVPPVIKMNNAPWDSCWYLTLEHLIAGHENPEGYRALKQYAEQFFLIARKKHFAVKSFNQTKIADASKLAETAATQALIKNFGFDETKISIALELRIAAHVSTGSDDDEIYTSKPGIITEENKQHLLHSICLKEMYKALDVQECKWTAARGSFDDLMAEIKYAGPLMVSGRFGKQCYSVYAFSNTTIAGRKIYQYPDDSIIPVDQSVSLHAVLIVGAEKSAKENLIYYIDPAEESDHPKINPKIYVINENYFRCNLYNIFGDHHAVSEFDNRNCPMFSCAPFLLAASDYGSLQVRFMQDQLAKRDEILQTCTAEKTPGFEWCDYNSLHSLSLVSKKYNARFSGVVREVDDKLMSELTHYARR